MNLWELFIIAVGLSMDAFAVSICKGLSVGRVSPRHALTCGVWFGGFQALMPAIGWLLGTRFQTLITTVDHWIAFVLLCIIGGNMVRESFGGEEEVSASFSPAAMLPLAVATSIDALAVGVTFALLPDVNLGAAVGCIGVTTLLLSAIGIKAGSIFGGRCRAKAQLAGGVILVLIGLKILVEHVFLAG